MYEVTTNIKTAMFRQKRILWSLKNYVNESSGVETLPGRDILTLHCLVTAKLYIYIVHTSLLFGCLLCLIQTYVNMIRIRSSTLCHSLIAQHEQWGFSSSIASVVSICHFIVNEKISYSQELVGIWPLLNSLPFSPCRNILRRSCPRYPGTCGRSWPLRCAALWPPSPPPV